MPITQLNIQSFRNLNSVSLQLEPCGVNLIQGKNGSGKTSLLEAIHFLGLGKSFRSHIINRIINHDADRFSLFAKLLDDNNDVSALGIERKRDGSSRMRLNGKDIYSAAELAEVLPLQLLEPHSFELLEGGPALRRSFLDWGVFHVEHNFVSIWKDYMRCIKQRNMALRSHFSRAEIFSWHPEIIQHGLYIEAARRRYVESFCGALNALLPAVIDLPTLSIQYYSGWTPGKSLESALEDSYSRDQALGYTQFGPHHADIKIKVDKQPAKAILSRGQQKLFVCAMKIAQGHLYQQVKQKRCIYLLDDLVAELDWVNQNKILGLLEKQKSQLFITCSNNQKIAKIINELPLRVFHVEHGKVLESVVA